MAFLTASASALLMFFFAGEFIGIKGFSRRPVLRSTMWSINVLFAILWVAAVAMLLFERTSGVILTLVLSVLWLIAQLRTHWTPYILGAPEEYRREYRHIFQNTVSILPRLTRRGIVPNLYHTLILILLVITIMSGILVLVAE